MVSVALLLGQNVLASQSQEARQNASSVALQLLDELLEATGRKLEEASHFAADLGPGSFIGARVATTLAKTFAFAQGAMCYGATSFDLISPSQTVVFPSKKGEWFIRRIGEPLIRSTELPEEPYVGFGPGLEPVQYPEAAGFVHLSPEEVEPERLMPFYAIEPSISLPKVPFRTPGGV